MAWLLRDGEVLASLEVADQRAARRKGLLGRDGIDGALLIVPARSVHSIGMRFPVDVAFCDRDGFVLHLTTLTPWRLSRPVPRAYFAIEATAGAFDRWKLAVGDIIEVKG